MSHFVGVFFSVQLKKKVARLWFYGSERGEQFGAIWVIDLEPQNLPNHRGRWRIIPVSKWLVTPIYKPFRPFIRGITPFRELTNHGY